MDANPDAQKYSARELASILQRKLEQIPHFSTILKIAHDNTDGNIWLIGGAVSRTLAKALYGTGDQEAHDFDIVTDKLLREPLNIPAGWTVSHSKFNNPTFTNPDGKTTLDLWPIASHEYIRKGKLAPTIENLLKSVPYTIQVLAYDLNTGELLGKEGIQALKAREFRLNNVDAAKGEARRKGQTIQQRMEAKAKSMGFEVIPPE